MYYYNARYYEPTIGRFISADSIVPNSANPQAFNRYSYCLNNPLRYVDPSGHGWPWDKVGNFCKGVGNAFVDTAKSTVQMVVNPVETAQALGHAITHPVETFNVIKDDYIEKAGSAEGMGEIFGEVLIMAATSGFGGGGVVGEKALATVLEKGAVKTLLKEETLITRTAGVVEKEGAVSQRTVVVGENMNRVRAAVEELGAETFEGEGMVANKAWIQTAREEGATIYDIGPDFSRRQLYLKEGMRPDSIYYNMERQELKGYTITKLWERTGKYWGVSKY